MSQDSRTENPSCDSVASPLPRNPATPQPTKEEDNNNNENITIITAPLQPPGSEGQHPLSGQRLVFQSGGNSSFGATCMERRDDSGDSPAPRSASSHLSQLMQAITEENEEEPTNPPLSRDAATLPLQYEEESNPLGEEKSYLFVDNHDGTGYLSATQRLDDGSLALGETVMLARLESSTMTRGSPLPRDFQSPLPHQDRLQQYTEGRDGGGGATARPRASSPVRPPHPERSSPSPSAASPPTVASALIRPSC
ncbi:hypothetical protein ADEAN_000925300 [Angomonas deanei]|uniref:Uncharacterized protein n=1 Tax=Angomonas deanei TaxID=59799 RepID=A0A7G2CPE4_9TRYP|nr:hypothetical protein ADEAN_000925300 [Angomonas deanei]